MNKPIISIIVPIYNSEKYLSRCIESLLLQTFNEIEIICVIDGSKDDSLKICNEYEKKDSRIITIVQENQGQAVARNTGLRHASGKYIQFCDPDDYYSLYMCEKLYNSILFSGADLAVVGIKIIYDQKNIIYGDREYYRIKYNGLTTVNEVVFRYIDSSVCNKIFNKSIIDKFDINFPVGLCYEDACFIFKYLLVSTTIFFNVEPFYYYIRHKDSIMGMTFEKTDRALDHVRILEDIKLFMINNNKNGLFQNDMFLWITVNYVQFVFYYGIDSAYYTAVEIAYNLLLDIPEINIMNCPYLNNMEIKKVLSIKYNDIINLNNLFKPENNLNNLKKINLFILPEGSKGRSIVKRIYKKFIKK